MKRHSKPSKPKSVENTVNASESAEYRKEKHVIQVVEYETKKPHTRATNKLRLSAKIRLNPTLKDHVINLDDNNTTSLSMKNKAHKPMKKEKLSAFCERVQEAMVTRLKKRKRMEKEYASNIDFLAEAVEQIEQMGQRGDVK